MWDHGHGASESIQVQVADVFSIDKDLAFALLKLYNPGQSHGDGGLACTSSANNSDLLSWSHLECQVVQNSVSVWSILEVDILELNLTFGRPVLLRDLSLFEFLLRNIVKVEDAGYANEGPLNPLVASEDVNDKITLRVEHKHEDDLTLSKTSVVDSARHAHSQEVFADEEGTKLNPLPRAVMGNELVG